MARTRSKPKAKATKESTPEPPTSNAKPLLPSTSNPPKLFVLPKDTSKDARIVTLDNPASGVPSRYYFCPDKGVHEFTRIAAPKKACRSWLITPEKSSGSNEEEEEGHDGTGIGSGYVTKAADLFVATPIDLMFLLLPVLAPKNAKETKQHFLALDDHLDNLSSSSRHWKVLLAQHPTLKAMIGKRMGTVCDTVDAGDETMYRLSHGKLLAMLLKKAERMCKNGLPQSMEEKFVKTALEVPVMNIKREESTLSVVSDTPSMPTEDSQVSVSTPSTSVESQLSTTTSMDSQTSTETAATSVSSTEEIVSKPALQTPPEVPHLLRLRTAFTYLLCSYVPQTLRPSLQELLKSSTTPSFTLLDMHLSAIAKLRAEAMALRSISDNISRKRVLEEDEEKMAEREEKKRKKEEDEKKKKTESRGIKQLKKADTSGMKKLSAFFAKAPKKG
ncbi:hypothetical protein BU26DRAFT_523095 [Trematosphaeria pertusa]|uniref:Ribonuclease H2 subunit B n=1 Tax=Trematosphaeria pertusa TaxID=390896 RepID=A0A6A6I2R8_9PLEO|nr:uncharacterized protein BU26DRAFT_523095 [Trematosphaeria pertusa]KAF2244449.1 hypothetical protein BU26DRAFT_523095 [Trematosphaeria pertusa]